MLAVGQVGERLPPALGAVRRQFTNEEWQREVASLMGSASAICATVGGSDALSWEIHRIIDLGYLAKTIFVFPPTSRREHFKLLAVLGSRLRVYWAELIVTRTGFGTRGAGFRSRASTARAAGPGSVRPRLRRRARGVCSHHLWLGFAWCHPDSGK